MPTFFHREKSVEVPQPAEVITQSETIKQPIVVNGGNQEPIPPSQPVSPAKETPAPVEKPEEKPVKQEQPMLENKDASGPISSTVTWSAVLEESKG